jgi:predicted  nucleic acid-binding Zn-ribbon protein
VSITTELKRALEIAKPIRELRKGQREQRKLEAAMATLDEINRQIAAAQEELAGMKRQIAELTKTRDTIVGEMKQIASRLEVR